MSPSNGRCTTRLAGATSEELVKPPATGGGSPIITSSFLSGLVQLTMHIQNVNMPAIDAVKSLFLTMFLNFWG
jgi:hypothetical protein